MTAGTEQIQVETRPILQYLLSYNQTNPVLPDYHCSARTTAQSCLVLSVVYCSNVHSQESNEDWNPASTLLTWLSAHRLHPPRVEILPPVLGRSHMSSICLSASCHPISLYPCSFPSFFSAYLPPTWGKERASNILFFPMEKEREGSKVREGSELYKWVECLHENTLVSHSHTGRLFSCRIWRHWKRSRNEF